jgi:integrase
MKLLGTMPCHMCQSPTEPVRETTKQANKRFAEQIEAAHKASLAKGEVGIREKKRVPTLRQFAECDFLPYVRATFTTKAKTLAYYDYGVKRLLGYEKLTDAVMDSITTETIAGYVAKRREAGLMVSSINRELQALRRMFFLVQEWAKVEKALPRVKMISGEQHRDRVLTQDEETQCLAVAPSLMYDVAIILLDCGLRPEECFRLQWSGNVRDGGIEVHYGKTDNARRRIPPSQRAESVLAMRKSNAASEWVFPAPTMSGHIEPSSLKKQHARARRLANLEPFPLYTFRHTCLTRRVPHMERWTLAKLAGHRDMAITKRYIHPEEQTIRAALEKARKAQGGHSSGYNGERASREHIAPQAVIQ